MTVAIVTVVPVILLTILMTILMTILVLVVVIEGAVSVVFSQLMTLTCTHKTFILLPVEL